MAIRSSARREDHAPGDKITWLARNSHGQSLESHNKIENSLFLLPSINGI
ncbi:hypothetical protein HMPREF3192_00618 [Atopobium deltae]|uniref:Uncharacterized protein n=1 Tax=Atopobium deltae TaxID=1393034 RepID=A0A133XVN0_9ACTN|nr:hypothetical protein HMPREF3192_00618 [Atopobium deltae]